MNLTLRKGVRLTVWEMKSFQFNPEKSWNEEAKANLSSLVDMSLLLNLVSGGGISVPGQPLHHCFTVTTAD